MARRLSPEEHAVWRRVAETAKRLHPPYPERGDGDRRESERGGTKLGSVPLHHPADAPPLRVKAQRGMPSTNTLDGSWDKRIAKGAIEPDFTIDLHGDTLASAHARLNRSLSAALRAGARVILLITGKPAADNPRLPPTSRGVIRASVKDWLAASPQAGQIAAIRNAHPRHGGAGALYIILRRAR